MKRTDIFYPNKLTKEEAENLSGWRLKAAVFHFGIGRGDCIRFGYGYGLRDSPTFNKKTIHLVADRDGILNYPIDLGDEIEWDNPSALLAETEMPYEFFLTRHVVASVENMSSALRDF